MYIRLKQNPSIPPEIVESLTSFSVDNPDPVTTGFLMMQLGKTKVTAVEALKKLGGEDASRKGRPPIQGDRASSGLIAEDSN